MTPDKDDLAYVWDCWNAVKKTLQYVENVDFDGYSENELLRLGVERLILIMGEAAGRISDDYRREHPGVAWQDLIRLRNLVAHSYEPEVVTRVWGSVKRVLPQAELQLECLLPPKLRDPKDR